MFEIKMARMSLSFQRVNQFRTDRVVRGDIHSQSPTGVPCSGRTDTSTSRVHTLLNMGLSESSETFLVRRRTSEGIQWSGPPLGSQRWTLSSGVRVSFCELDKSCIESPIDAETSRMLTFSNITGLSSGIRIILRRSRQGSRSLLDVILL